MKKQRREKRKAGLLLLLVCLIALIAFPVTTSAAVKLNKKTVSVFKGKTYKLKVTGTKKKAKWTSSDPKVAIVSSSGIIKGVSKGQCTISAKISTKSYTCKVTVKQRVTSVNLSRTSVKLNPKDKLTLKATVAPENANTKTITWKSSNKKVATVSSKGVVTAKKTGTTKITATAKDGSKKKATCKITVTKSCLHKKIATKGSIKPTFTEAGYSGDTYCADCKKSLSVGKTLPKRTDYRTVSLTTNNWNQYFEIIEFAEVTTKTVNAFGDKETWADFDQYITIKPQYRDKIIGELSKGTVELTAIVRNRYYTVDNNNHTLKLGNYVDEGYEKTSIFDMSYMEYMAGSICVMSDNSLKVTYSNENGIKRRLPTIEFNLHGISRIYDFTDAKKNITEYRTIAKVGRVIGTLYFEL